MLVDTEGAESGEERRQGPGQLPKVGRAAYFGYIQLFVSVLGLSSLVCSTAVLF